MYGKDQAIPEYVYGVGSGLLHILNNGVIRLILDYLASVCFNNDRFLDVIKIVLCYVMFITKLDEIILTII